MRILITDASTKHAIAIQRYLKETFPGYVLIGYDKGWWSLARWYGYLDRRIWGQPLLDILKSEALDLVIPVGAASVVAVSEIAFSKAVLPDPSTLVQAFDKFSMIRLATELGIPHPVTVRITEPRQVDAINITYPCVVKPSREIDAKVVYYAQSPTERDAAISRVLQVVPHTYGALVQEYVEGRGYGVEALYDKGRVVRLFMHERLREYPVTGGASTAARAVYHDRLRNYATMILDALKWHGLAMVEFKYDSVRQDFVLMEVNPKCWGSMELALRAGMNFPVDLIRVFRGEKLEYSDNYNRKCRFYWPLDGDLLNLLKTRQLRKVQDYWRSESYTNLGQSWLGDTYKSIRLVRDVVKLILESKD